MFQKNVKATGQKKSFIYIVPCRTSKIIAVPSFEAELGGIQWQATMKLITHPVKATIQLL